VSIPTKDQKILWSRASGLCAICRRELSEDASEHVPSGAIVVGEMAHIVGEKPGSPRGKSVLTRKDRNRYPNLILLCPRHHKVVDGDPKKWPIEVLHQRKADHEQWVRDRVRKQTDEIDEFYAKRVNDLTEGLWLQRWDTITSMAVRDQLPLAFCNDARATLLRIVRTPWPGRHTVIDAAFRAVAERVGAYLDAFHERASVSGTRGQLVAHDRSWKARGIIPQDEYEMHSNADAEWQRRCLPLLFNATFALTEFARAVRATLQPTYFLDEGDFVVNDELGAIDGSFLEGGGVYMPDDYRPVPAPRKRRRRRA
jgi:hypothetical protein